MSELDVKALLAMMKDKYGNMELPAGAKPESVVGNVWSGNIQAEMPVDGFRRGNDGVQGLPEFIDVKPASDEDEEKESPKAAENNSSNVVMSKPSTKAEQKVIERHKELQAAQDKLNELAETEQASNGVTYAEAKKTKAQIYSRLMNLVQVYADENGKPYSHRLTDEEILEELEKECAANPKNSKLREMTNDFRRALEAEKELEAKHPELKEWEPIDEKPKEMPAFIMDPNGGVVVGKQIVTKRADGTVETKYLRPDGSLESISVEYLGGGRVSEYFDQNGNPRGKIITQEDGDTKTTTFVDAKGKVISSQVKQGDKITIKDANGNIVEPNSDKAKELGQRVAEILNG